MASTASVVRAAEIVGMDRTNHYVWFKNDPDYAAAFETARMQGVDVLEAEAVRRAYEGVAKPIFHGGKRAVDVVQNPDGSIKRDASGEPIGIPEAVREYSDTLLMLKGRNPAVFGDRQQARRARGRGDHTRGPIRSPAARRHRDLANGRTDSLLTSRT